jgi:RNA polymerase sigma factor (sigma-70 family)
VNARAVQPPRPDWDEAWIADQERCPAAVCCPRIACELADLVTRLTPLLTADRVGPGDKDFPDYLQRLWRCVEYHWRQRAGTGPVPFAEVFRHLDRPHPAHSVKNHLPGEVLLAVALQQGQARAAERFEADYMPTIRAVARQVGGERALDAVENFAAELVLPRLDRPPRIATFQGRTTLSNWLVPVVSNFWRTQVRRAPAHGLALLHEPATDGAMTLTVQEEPCEELLRPMFRDSVQAIGAEDRLLLQMLVLDGVPQKRLAQSLGLHSGTLTRRRQRAVEAVLDHMTKLMQANARPQQINDCLQLLLAGDDPELRSRLAAVLAEGVRA